VVNLKQNSILDKSIVESLINYLNTNCVQIEAKNIAIALKTFSEIQQFRSMIKDLVDWEAMSKHIFQSIKNDNNMMLLQNLSHLEPYISERLHDKLFKSTMMRMENELKMQFF
jgi:hypothetical protein